MVHSVTHHREPVIDVGTFAEIMTTDEDTTASLLAPLVTVGDYTQPAHGEDFSRLYHDLSVVPFRTPADVGFS
jgi:hypothetical protein